MSKIEDKILELKIAFANIELQGLFFWDGLLFLNDEEFNKTIEKKLIETIENLPKNDHIAIEHYQKILKNLQTLRHELPNNPQLKEEIEGIYKHLISETTYSDIINELKKQSL